jgi:hypothetical protein
LAQHMLVESSAHTRSHKLFQVSHEETRLWSTMFERNTTPHQY